MPGRKYSAGSGYRYGFNGKENDKEVKGDGNQQDYGMRIYDTRLSRFLSTDPLIKQYPELSPFQFASNTPVQAIDLDGLEKFYYARSVNDKGQTVLTPLRSEPLIESRQVFIGYAGGRSAMTDPQPIYKTVKEVNQRQEYIIYSPIDRPITKGANVLWEKYQGIAIYNTLDEAKSSKSADFKLQTFDIILHYGVQGLINLGEEYQIDRPGKAPLLKEDLISTELKEQKQLRQHTLGGDQSKGKGTMNTKGDAQAVLKAYHNGEGNVIDADVDNNKVLFQFDKIPGNNNNKGTSQNSNTFIIKGKTEGAVVVPTTPGKKKL
jgi:RHS repeat-associated protein